MCRACYRLSIHYMLANITSLTVFQELIPRDRMHYAAEMITAMKHSKIDWQYHDGLETPHTFFPGQNVSSMRAETWTFLVYWSILKA